MTSAPRLGTGLAEPAGSSRLSGHEPHKDWHEQPTSVLALAVREPGGFDVAVAVGARLDVEGLNELALVSKFFAAACRDETVWKPQLKRLLAGKVHVPRQVRRSAEAGRHRAACAEAVREAKKRSLTAAELGTYEWHMRTKTHPYSRSGAGGVSAAVAADMADMHAAMRAGDPWWKGGAPSRGVFCADGRMLQRLSPEDSGPPSRIGTWRFVTECAGRAGPEGTMLRTVRDEGQIEAPTVFIKRAPNWGWLMEGPVHIAQSWPVSGSETPADPPELLSVDDLSLPNQTEELDACRRAAAAFYLGDAGTGSDAEGEPEAESGEGGGGGQHG